MEWESYLEKTLGFSFLLQFLVKFRISFLYKGMYTLIETLEFGIRFFFSEEFLRCKPCGGFEPWSCLCQPLMQKTQYSDSTHSCKYLEYWMHHACMKLEHETANLLRVRIQWFNFIIHHTIYSSALVSGLYYFFS